ncbi:hypothetical protein VUR80DRAFT_8520 [Thermomyces stellatus]
MIRKPEKKGPKNYSIVITQFSLICGPLRPDHLFTLIPCPILLFTFLASLCRLCFSAPSCSPRGSFGFSPRIRRPRRRSCGSSGSECGKIVACFALPLIRVVPWTVSPP